MMNCVIRIPAKDSFVTSGPQLMGRQSANEGFLKAWFEFTEHHDYWCMARYKDEAQVFAKIGKAVHQKLSRPLPTYRWIQQSDIHKVNPVGTVFLPGPQVAEVSWIRRRNAQTHDADFSIVGMTHTSCEMSVQDALANMLTAPVFPWDAQICPSYSVRDMVQRLLDDESAWLREHLQASRLPKIELPILSLGIDCASFDIPITEKKQHRSAWRKRWNLPEETICALYVGRFDLRSKASLYPMFDALELAAKELAATGGPPLVCVLAGWYQSDWDEQAIAQAQMQVCPNVRLIIEDGRPLATRSSIWFSADFFTSLVDNIQETFGLTPIEAMAAGLPVVVTDYDGYKESVRHDVNGFRIPTIQAPSGCGIHLINQHADLMLSYRNYVGQASAMIGVDISAAARAYVSLARSTELRQKMGMAGKARAQQRYDWQQLIPKYQNLWQDLSLVRQQHRQNKVSCTQTSKTGPYPPRRRDPLHSFEHYPSTTLNENTVICVGPLSPTTDADCKKVIQQLVSRPLYSHLAHDSFTELAGWILKRATSGSHGLRIGDLQSSNLGTERLYPVVAVLIKNGLLDWEKRIPQNATENSSVKP